MCMKLKVLKKKDEEALLFIFEDMKFNVLTKHVKNEDLEEVINYITDSKEV